MSMLILLAAHYHSSCGERLDPICCLRVLMSDLVVVEQKKNED